MNLQQKVNVNEAKKSTKHTFIYIFQVKKPTENTKCRAKNRPSQLTRWLYYSNKYFFLWGVYSLCSHLWALFTRANMIVQKFQEWLNIYVSFRAVDSSTFIVCAKGQYINLSSATLKPFTFVIQCVPIELIFRHVQSCPYLCGFSHLWKNPKIGWKSKLVTVLFLSRPINISIRTNHWGTWHSSHLRLYPQYFDWFVRSES